MERDVAGGMYVTHRGFKSWPELLPLGLLDCIVSSCGWAKSGDALLFFILEGEWNWRRQVGTFLCIIPEV